MDQDILIRNNAIEHTDTASIKRGIREVIAKKTREEYTPVART